MVRKETTVSNIKHLTVKEFNKLYPVGTRVKYWPVRTQTDEFVEARTTTPAWQLYCGTNVVGLTVGAGGYCFDNIAVI